MPDLKTLDPQSILFVGGKSFNIPKCIRPQIKIAQWESDDERYSSPSPAPDLVVVMTQFASHGKTYRGREYAKTLNIPILEAAGSKSDMIKRAEQEGYDITGIFEKKKTKEIIMPRKQCKRIEGDIRDFILDKANELKFTYPLKQLDAEQLRNLVLTDLNIEVKEPQIQRVIRIAYRGGKYPRKSSTREIPIAKEPTTSEEVHNIDAAKMAAEAEVPKPEIAPHTEHEFKLTNSAEGIFKKLFEMHDRILSLLDEKSMYAEEVAKLSAENKALKEKLEKLSKIESLLNSYK